MFKFFKISLFIFVYPQMYRFHIYICVCVLEILFLYNKIRCLYYRNINFHIHIEILQNFYNSKHHFPLFLILKIIKTICIDLKGKKSSRQFIVEHWNMSSARQKFWFQIREGVRKKEKGSSFKVQLQAAMWCRSWFNGHGQYRGRFDFWI